MILVPRLIFEKEGNILRRSLIVYNLMLIFIISKSLIAGLLNVRILHCIFDFSVWRRYLRYLLTCRTLILHCDKLLLILIALNSIHLWVNNLHITGPFMSSHVVQFEVQLALLARKYNCVF
jgi:hypothetical protein